jgi:hypothetical protein
MAPGQHAGGRGSEPVGQAQERQWMIGGGRLDPLHDRRSIFIEAARNCFFTP